MALPLQYFKYKSSSEKDGRQYEEERHNVAKVNANLAYLVYSDWLKQEPPNWPNFQVAADSNSIPSLFQSHDRWEWIALVLDDSGKAHSNLLTPFTAQITLDWAVIPQLGVLAARTSHPVVGGQISDTPALLLFKRGDPEPVHVSRSASLPSCPLQLQSNSSFRKKMLRAELNARIAETAALKTPVDTRELASAGPIEGNSGPEPPEEPAEAVDVSGVNRYQVTMEDMVTGLSYSLRREVARKKQINAEQLGALRAFLGVMSQYFPGLPPVRRLLFRLSNWLSEMREREMSGEAWAKGLETHQTELGRPLPVNGSWVACQGSQAKWRGYPCSLWTIFHALTVAAYKADGLKDPAFKPQLVLSAIYGFVSNFFGCADCVQHFSEHAEKIQTDVKQPEDVVLWLWRVHNDANRRTKGTLSSDPAFPKEQFPPALLCPKCRDEEGEWDLGMVLGFLMKFYGDDIVATKAEQKLANYKVAAFDKSGKKTVIFVASPGSDLAVSTFFRRASASWT